MKLNVLVACEFSGIVRDAFIKAGHNAVSCDFLSSESPGPHYQGNVLDLFCSKWHLMIAFPPCTFLSYAGNSSWFNPGRTRDRLKALNFFNDLWEAPIDHIAIENPAGIVHAIISPYTQIIHPYYFGDPEMKRTYLWLKNLPALIHSPEHTLFSCKTHIPKPKPIRIQPSGKPVNFCESHGTKSTRAALRSKTFPGIANAMVNQWVPHINSCLTQS